MHRTYSSIDKIRDELAWVNETPDPNKCGCRNARCCEETGHKAGACMGGVTTKLWTFRWEYYCVPCREYDGVAIKLAATDSRVNPEALCLSRICSNRFFKLRCIFKAAIP